MSAESSSASRSFRTALFKPDLEVDERLRGPQQLAKLVARNQFAGAHQERSEDLEGLVGKTDLEAVPAKLSRLGVELEYPEAKHVRVRRPGFHGSLQTERGAVYPVPSPNTNQTRI